MQRESETFDPYHIWLGIPPDEQPPNHYRLLGVGLFESHIDVIEMAADRQMGHLRMFQSGKHPADAERLLNEVAAAKLCLMNAEKRAAYERELLQRPSQQLAADVAEGSAVVTEELPSWLDTVKPTSPISRTRRISRKRPSKLLPTLVIAGTGLLVVAALLALNAAQEASMSGSRRVATDGTAGEGQKQLAARSVEHRSAARGCDAGSNIPAAPAPTTSVGAHSAEPTNGSPPAEHTSE